MSIQFKRVYASPQNKDGLPILVDRLWPRGLRKQDAAIDQWLRECAPSGELRRWFGHDRTRWKEFKRRYFIELKGKEELLAPLRALAKKRHVTLLFGASDTEHNNAVALSEYLGMKKWSKRRAGKPIPRTAPRRPHPAAARGGK
jgi:uncharacterized protein YeaO (DUF488 family)